GLVESDRALPPPVSRVVCNQVRDRVALPSEEAAGDVEVPGKLIEAADVERPLGVDESRSVVVIGDVAIGAAVPAALGTFEDSSGVAVDADLVGRIETAPGDAADLLLPVGPGERAVRHPAVGQPLVQLKLDAVVADLVALAVGLEGAVAVGVRDRRVERRIRAAVRK